jgi:hypothetical protein
MPTRHLATDVLEDFVNRSAAPGGGASGYRGVLFVQPDVTDPEIGGLVVKVPGTTWGVGQDYAEGNFLVMLGDADNFVAAPVAILLVVAGTTNATPVVVTTTAPHGLTTGDVVRLTDTTIGALDNKWWKITVLSATTFSLNTSTAPGAAAGAGSVFTDRSPVIGRWADTGPGIAGGMHVAPGLRGRSGVATPAYGIFVQNHADAVNLILGNASSAVWAPSAGH